MARTPEQKARAAEQMRGYRAAKKVNGILPPRKTDEQKKRQAEAQARFRERQKERGIGRVVTDKERQWQREYMSARRAEAKAKGETLPSDEWWTANPDKHRRRVRNWRAENFERSQEINRQSAELRRSTPWGKINNRMWPMVHRGVRMLFQPGKYNYYLGYTWADLRAHLEKQFSPIMNWGNWGDVWELDHIKPLSSFQYTSLDDPLFRECWALTNLRPLLREENASKGAKHF